MAKGKNATHQGKTAERQSHLVRKGRTHIDNTASGYMAHPKWQSHHILCIDSVGSRVWPSGLEASGEACLWSTVWDINATHNVIGMPVSSCFRDNDGKMGMKICNHAVDHNTNGGYRDECTQDLKTKIWNHVTKVVDDKEHTITPEDLAEDLRAASDRFRGYLADRADREEGTLVMWTKRHDKEAKDTWYIPFSMADDGEVQRRSPGVDMSNFTNLFKRIK